ncbi:MAG: bifunctional ADP-heptose synthase [Selenomonadaceae bacterium]|nr:bifunctional ADP-heptose synthase [Selenomonadaceae bacterium]
MQQDLASQIQKFAGRRILVLGDMVADIYLDGRISRISREAPVLVLQQVGERTVPGGAANVVNNIATLGGEVYAVGMIGEDKAAKGLVEALQKHGVHTEGLFVDRERPTISKTRIIAGGRATVSQQIVRVDRESCEPVRPGIEVRAVQYIRGLLPSIDGVVISDYGSGMVTDALKDELIAYCRAHDIPSIVDSRYAIHRFTHSGYVKQNDAELAEAVGRNLPDEEALCAAGRELLQELSADGVLVTRGERGMILFEKNGSITNIPVTDKSEVFDVSGAGDTCVAAVILALAGGTPPADAARISNFASGIAVRKLGTSTVSIDELRNALQK